MTTGRIAAAHGQFNGIHQMAPVCFPINTCFLGPTRVQIPNGISIASVDFAQLTTERPYFKMGRFSLKIPRSHGGSGPPAKSNPWAQPSPQSKGHLDRFSSFCRAHYCDRQTDRQTDREFDRQTDHATRSVTIGRIYSSLRTYSTAMWQ